MRDLWPAYYFVKSMTEIALIFSLVALYGLFCWSLIRKQKPEGGAIGKPAALAGVAFTQLPKLRYDCEVFDSEHEEMAIADYLTAKGRTGWRLHTIQRFERAQKVEYFLTWDRLEREVTPYEQYRD